MLKPIQGFFIPYIMDSIEKILRSLTVVKKAWVINPEKMSEPWFCDDSPEYGTRGQAKLLLLCNYDDMKNQYGEELTFLNIPIKRTNHYDKVLFRGEECSLIRAENVLRKEIYDKNLDNLLENNPNAKAFIIKGGSYYGSNHCGYLSRSIDAGVYTLKEAVNTCKHCSLSDNMQAVIIDKKEYNQMLLNKINELKGKISGYENKAL